MFFGAAATWYTNDMVIYVIGFIGSDRMAVARAASEQHGIPLYDLAAEIQERDGRTIRRMVITMGEHELRTKEYETLTAILRELGEPADPSEIAVGTAAEIAGSVAVGNAIDPDLPTICSRNKQQADAAGLGEDPACTASNDSAAACGYSAVICCTDDLILDPMSADLVRAGEVIIADDPATAGNPELAIARLDAMFERAIAQAPDDQSLHYAFLLDPDKAAAREKFMKLYEQRRPLYESFRK